MNDAWRMCIELPRMAIVLLLRMVVGEMMRSVERVRRARLVVTMRVWEGRSGIVMCGCSSGWNLKYLSWLWSLVVVLYGYLE